MAAAAADAAVPRVRSSNGSAVGGAGSFDEGTSVEGDVRVELDSCLLLPPPSHWHYRIEGAQKAIFSAVPLPASPYDPSRSIPYPLALCVYTTLLSPQTRHQNPYNLKHQSHFRRYLSTYLIIPASIPLPSPYLAHLARSANPHRPSSRKNLSSIALSNHAELLPDIALRFGPDTLLVELKPKSGVLSRSALVHPSITSSLQKFSLPIYHIKNYLLPQGISGPLFPLPPPNRRYNPVDLLRAIDVRNQLHNLHVENSRSLRVFSAGALLSHSKGNKPCSQTLCPIALDVASRALSVPQDNRKSCLAGVREIQNMDYVDNIGAAFLLNQLTRLVGKPAAYEMISRYMYEDDMRNDEDFMRQFEEARLAICYETSEDAARLHSEEMYERAVSKAQELEPVFLALMLADFMQAAAAKDCSIMVAMCLRDNVTLGVGGRSNSEDVFRVVCKGEKDWLCSISVVDTGEKSMAKILDKWSAIDLQRRDKIVAAGGLPLEDPP